MALRRRAGHVVQVEPRRMGVQLQHLAVVAGGLHHRLQVDLVGLPLQQHPAGGMGDRRDVRILQGLDHPAGDLLARLLLAVVDAGHDPIGLGQHVVGQVEPAAFENVDLDALEHRDAVEPLVELVDFGPLLPQPLGVQPVDHRHALRVVGDGDVLQAALLGGGGHFLDARRAVGPRAVHVQVAADVVQLDQLGQLAGVGPLELAPGLAQLGRKAGQVQRARRPLLPCGRRSASRRERRRTR